MEHMIEKNCKNERIRWVDAFKGMCIILMVLGHSGTPFVSYIYLFHMAVFFMISGYTYSGRKFNVSKYIKRKVISLLIPYYAINVVFVLIYIVFQKLGFGTYIQIGESMSLIERLNLLFSLRPGTTELGGASWFLLVLFEAECLCRIFTWVCDSIFFLKGKDLLLMIFSGLLGYVLAKNGYYLPFEFDLSLLAMLFFAIGIFICRYNVLSRIPAKITAIISIIVFLFFGGAYFAGSLPTNWPTRLFPDIHVLVVCSIAGFYLVYFIICCLDYFPLCLAILEFMGKRTFVILMYHFIGFRLCSAILIVFQYQPVSVLTASPPSGSLPLLWIIYSVFTILFCLLLSKLAEKNKFANYMINGKIGHKER